MFRQLTVPVAAALVLGVSLAWAADRTWHPDLDAGVAAARKSGKPILVVTAWKSGI